MARKSKSKLDYFQAFKRQAEFAVEEADVLIEIIENFTTAEAIKQELPRAHRIEHAADELNYEILSAVDVDFITPIEREDIIAMAQRLDDVVDSIEDIIQRFYMFDVHFMHDDAKRLAQMIRQACVALADVMEDFGNFKKSDKFKEGIAVANEIEEAADEVFLGVSHDLFTKESDHPMRAMVWMEIFHRMERTTDRCMEVADTMSSIVLKNS